MSSTVSRHGPSGGSSAEPGVVSGLRWARPSVQVLDPDSGKPAALAWRLRLVGRLSVPAALAFEVALGGSRTGPRGMASDPSFLGSSWEGGEAGDTGTPAQALPQFPQKHSGVLEGLQPDPTGGRG